MIITLKYCVERLLENGTIIEEWKSDDVVFNTTPDEITMKQWVDFWVKKSNFPEWYLEIETLKPSDLSDRIAQFNEKEWQEYALLTLSLVSCFCDKPELVAQMPILSNEDDSILALYRKIADSIYSYKPRDSRVFEFKNEKFILPKKVIDTFDREWWGAELSTGEAIEAMQASHVLNAKNEFGEYVLQDRKYHTDIAIMAALSRKVLKDGTVEKFPYDTVKIREFMDRRIKFFSDAPMSIALDVAFFLKSSKLRSGNTPIFQSHTNHSHLQ